jgi:hypothetical protein
VKLSYNLAVPFRLSVLDRVTGHLQLAGRPGGTYTIQGSTNFVNWFPLVTTNTALGVFEYRDPTAPALSNRFYRAVNDQ